MHLLKIKYHKHILRDQGDGPHPNKKSTQFGELHQQATSANQRVIPGRYNPLEYIVNINKLDNLNLKKLKTSITIVTTLTL